MDDLALAGSLFFMEKHLFLVPAIAAKRDKDGMERRKRLMVPSVLDPMSNSTDQQPLGENLKPAPDTP